MTDSREFKSTWPSHQHLPAVESGPVDEMDSRKNLAGPRGLEPLPFSAPSLARKAPEVELEPESESEIEPEPETRLEAVAAPVAAAEDEPEFCADWQTAPLDGLGLVQLVQRLGSTIERRRERLAQEPAPVAAPAAPLAAPPADFEPAPAEEAAQAMAAFFAPNPEPESDEAGAAASTFEPAQVEAEPEPEAEPVAMARPGFMSSFASATDDEDEEEDSFPEFSLPLRRPVAAAPAMAPADNDATDQAGPEATDADEEAGDESEAGYSSLLGMNNPFVAPKAEFVRIEQPEEEAELAEPTVVFPGQEEPAQPAEPAPVFASRLFDAPGKAAAPAASALQAPADADAALRAALATLQRMSGAA